MAITFPLSMPSSPGIKSITWEGLGNTAITESIFTKQRQYFQFPGELIRAQIQLPIMTRVQAGPWIGWGNAMRGRHGTFHLRPATGERAPLGPATGTPQIDGGGQTGETINTKGWTVSQSPIIKAGSWISFGNAIERLYLVLIDANSDGSGDAVLELYPRVREATTDSDGISVSGALGLFRLDSDVFSWSVELLTHTSVSFKVVEAI